jgi:hypothetical protein
MYNLGSYPGIVPAAVYVWNGRVYPEDKMNLIPSPGMTKYYREVQLLMNYRNDEY